MKASSSVPIKPAGACILPQRTPFAPDWPDWPPVEGSANNPAPEPARQKLGRVESDTVASKGCSSEVRVAGSVVLSLGLWSAPAGAQMPAVDFWNDIEPILRQHCQGCHGETVRSGGLRLDNSRDATHGGHSGVAIEPGDGAGSLLVRMLSRPLREGGPMPLASDPLSVDQIRLLTVWIDQGAPWPAARPASSHWAFQRPVRPTVPGVRGGGWVRNPIDSFVKARLEAEGIRPSPEADPATLLRRMSLDLTGLPPAPDWVKRMETGADSYGDLVGRLLASPHHGEMQALHWLDQARFGESDGYQADYIRPFAWRWRHWVVDAFNRNLSFDRFTIEQIAGDLIPGATLEQRVATGFHRNSLHNREGGFPIEMDRVERTVERTSAVSTVWLGLTVGCARCHDHKFDPISQKDFYELYAFFNTATEADIDAPLPGELEPYGLRRPQFELQRAELFERYRIPELQAYWERMILAAATDAGSDLEPIWKILWDLLLFELDGGTETVRTPVRLRTPKQQDRLSRYFVRNVVGGYDFQAPEGYEDLDFKELREEYKRLEAAFPPLTQGYTMVTSPSPPQTRILLRGDYRRPGDPVVPAAPAVLPSIPAAVPDRLMLANWLVSPQNPLTARVTVNRVWQQYFGTGLVSTPEDFGTRGDPPSHPDLLDWLAVEFMESGWDLKVLHRLIVTSSTYRQSSEVRPELMEIDPSNRLLARQSRVRLPAETIRDAAFAAAGNLDRRIGGASVRPYLPEGATEIGFGNFVQWPQSVGADNYRRGLYIFRQRTLPYPQLATFDAPDTVQVACKRDRSTTPLQALTLLNDPVFAEAASLLARRLVREGGVNPGDRIRYAFELCLSRDPSPAEVDRLLEYYESQRRIFAHEAAKASQQEPRTTLDDVESNTWTAVASVLLNLTEFLTRS